MVLFGRSVTRSPVQCTHPKHGTGRTIGRNAGNPSPSAREPSSLRPQGPRCPEAEPATRNGRGLFLWLQSSRSAVVTGRRAARTAGNKPPMNPIASAHFRPVHSSSGVTRRWTASRPTEPASHRRRVVVVEEQPRPPNTHRPRRPRIRLAQCPARAESFPIPPGPAIERASADHELTAITQVTS